MARGHHGWSPNSKRCNRGSGMRATPRRNGIGAASPRPRPCPYPVGEGRVASCERGDDQPHTGPEETPPQAPSPCPLGLLLRGELDLLLLPPQYLGIQHLELHPPIPSHAEGRRVARDRLELAVALPCESLGEEFRELVEAVLQHRPRTRGAQGLVSGVAPARIRVPGDLDAQIAP